MKSQPGFSDLTSELTMALAKNDGLRIDCRKRFLIQYSLREFVFCSALLKFSLILSITCFLVPANHRDVTIVVTASFLGWHVYVTFNRLFASPPPPPRDTSGNMYSPLGGGGGRL